jgi:hypothetical protein
VLKALAYANALVDLSGPLAYEAAYERRRAPGDEGPSWTRPQSRGVGSPGNPTRGWQISIYDE